MTSTPVLLAHGGAGRLAPQRQAAAQQGMHQAVVAGWRLLAQGAAALDAVVATIEILEDDPQFNAGRGSVCDAQGDVQMDAALMTGHDLAAGAVANVRRLRHPIVLARHLLMDPHLLMLVAQGAEQYATQVGMMLCDPAELQVPKDPGPVLPYATVGCVALDSQGRLAAGTSTGGCAGSLPGRVGDSPLIGAGTYADGEAAVSCTGIGEDIIRCVLAYRAAVQLAAGVEAMTAAQLCLRQMIRTTASQAGLILLDRQGRPGYAHNTEHMLIGMCSQARGLRLALAPGKVA